jgi:hypothetical protein
MFSTFRNTAVSLGAAAFGLSLVAVPKADAAYVAYIYQNGANVVVTGSGSIDLTDLSLFGANEQTFPEMFPAIGVIITGPAAFGAIDQYSGFAGPTSFGGFTETNVDSGSGDIVGLDNAQSPNPTLFVPAGYVSGHALSDSSTYDDETLSSIDVNSGTYTWTWGTGVHADSYTLHIGEAPPIPEPASLTLLAMGLVGLGMVLRTRRA